MLSIKHHDFGVNALACKRLSPTSLLIATGGDDQQLAFSVLDLNTSTITLTQKLSAHSSCVKAVVLERRGGDLIAKSSGYDQRFKTWLWAGDHAELLSVVRHCLSDMNGAASVGGTTVLVGQGIAIFE